MGLDRIGGPKREQKTSRQDQIRMLKLQGKQISSGGGMSRTSKLLVETVAHNRGGMSKAQIQKRLQKIKNKLKAGARLTGEEKEFLREHAPELYRKVIALERERAAYEEQLKTARTRDDAENIRMARMKTAAAIAQKEDAEFLMIRTAQLQAAEAETRSQVLSKPWKRELDRERREKRERAAKSQANTERRMKRLRKWDNGKVREVVAGEEEKSKMEQGTPNQGLSEHTKKQQEYVPISQGKAVYSAVACKVTDNPPEEDGTYSKKA
ncbi:MAG: hypothetical protein HFG59_11065 [Lachnospiraceae bacterium]|nr:hypothetical protein [Lachnospiraceae bacterium]